MENNGINRIKRCNVGLQAATTTLLHQYHHSNYIQPADRVLCCHRKLNFICNSKLHVVL